jgi:hypothetical protein
MPHRYPRHYGRRPYGYRRPWWNFWDYNPVVYTTPYPNESIMVPQEQVYPQAIKHHNTFMFLGLVIVILLVMLFLNKRQV